MGRKSRHTAKTGDKGLKKQAAASVTKSMQQQEDDHDDTMYNEVDKFHLQRQNGQEEFLRLDSNTNLDSGDSGESDDEEGVMDLGISASPDDSNDSDSDSDSDQDAPMESDEENESQDEMDEEDSESDDDEDERTNQDRILDWGSRKRDYYHGDTADLEIGQDFEDAKVEEQAGREIQQLRLDRLEEDDFLPFSSQPKITSQQDPNETKLQDSDNDDEDEHDDDNEEEMLSTHRRQKIQKLKPSEQQAVLETQHPEFFPIVQYFTDRFVRELQQKVLVVSQQLLSDPDQAKTVGTNTQGMEYLHQKQMLLMSTTLNLCTYLLMKCQAVKKEANQSKTSSFTDNLEGISQNHQDVRHHPIIARLDTMSQMADQFEKYVEEPLQLKEQLNSLLQAVKLMQTEGIQNSDHTDDDEERGQDEDMPSVASSVEEHAQEMKERGSFTSSPDDDHNDEEGYHDELQEQNLMNDARFGLRPQDITETSRRNGRSKSRAESTRRSVPLSTSDYGDEDDNQDNKAIRLSASCKLATTMNRVKQKKSKMNFSNVSEGIDDMQEHPTIGAGAGESMDEYERGLKMMEDAVGPLGDNDDEAADDIDPELGDDENDVGNEFYNQLKKESQQKKQKRKEMYTVAPKYPTLDTEVEGERAIGNMIMKNRGLIPHKNKLNRNPRVKKREQYRKALIRRRGAVREVRTNEAHVYGGEATGIKAGLSRSRKLGVRK